MLYLLCFIIGSFNFIKKLDDFKEVSDYVTSSKSSSDRQMLNAPSHFAVTANVPEHVAPRVMAYGAISCATSTAVSTTYSSRSALYESPPSSNYRFLSRTTNSISSTTGTSSGRMLPSTQSATRTISAYSSSIDSKAHVSPPTSYCSSTLANTTCTTSTVDSFSYNRPYTCSGYHYTSVSSSIDSNCPISSASSSTYTSSRLYNYDKSPTTESTVLSLGLNSRYSSITSSTLPTCTTSSKFDSAYTGSYYSSLYDKPASSSISSITTTTVTTSTTTSSLDFDDISNTSFSYISSRRSFLNSTSSSTCVTSEAIYSTVNKPSRDSYRSSNSISNYSTTCTAFTEPTFTESSYTTTSSDSSKPYSSRFLSDSTSNMADSLYFTDTSRRSYLYSENRTSLTSAITTSYSSSSEIIKPLIGAYGGVTSTQLYPSKLSTTSSTSTCLSVTSSTNSLSGSSGYISKYKDEYGYSLSSIKNLSSMSSTSDIGGSLSSTSQMYSTASISDNEPITTTDSGSYSYGSSGFTYRSSLLKTSTGISDDSNGSKL